MAVTIVMSEAFQLSRVRNRHAAIAAKYPVLGCFSLESRDDGFFLKFDNAVLGTGNTAEMAVVMAVETVAKFGANVPGVPVAVSPLLVLWARKMIGD